GPRCRLGDGHVAAGAGPDVARVVLGIVYSRAGVAIVEESGGGWAERSQERTVGAGATGIVNATDVGSACADEVQDVALCYGGTSVFNSVVATALYSVVRVVAVPGADLIGGLDEGGGTIDGAGGGSE